MTWQRWLMAGCFAVATVLLWEDHESRLTSKETGRASL